VPRKGREYKVSYTAGHPIALIYDAVAALGSQGTQHRLLCDLRANATLLPTETFRIDILDLTDNDLGAEYLEDLTEALERHVIVEARPPRLASREQEEAWTRLLRRRQRSTTASATQPRWPDSAKTKPQPPVGAGTVPARAKADKSVPGVARFLKRSLPIGQAKAKAKRKRKPKLSPLPARPAPQQQSKSWKQDWTSSGWQGWGSGSGKWQGEPKKPGQVEDDEYESWGAWPASGKDAGWKKQDYGGSWSGWQAPAKKAWEQPQASDSDDDAWGDWSTAKVEAKEEAKTAKEEEEKGEGEDEEEKEEEKDEAVDEAEDDNEEATSQEAGPSTVHGGEREAGPAATTDPYLMPEEVLESGC